MAPYGTCITSMAQFASQLLPSGSYAAPINANGSHAVPMAPVRCTWHPIGACRTLMLPSTSYRHTWLPYGAQSSCMAPMHPIWLSHVAICLLRSMQVPYNSYSSHTAHAAPIWHHPPPVLLSAGKLAIVGGDACKELFATNIKNQSGSLRRQYHA
jgi:hypothetical protein